MHKPGLIFAVSVLTKYRRRRRLLFTAKGFPHRQLCPLLPVPQLILLIESNRALERAEELKQEQDIGPVHQKRFFIWEPSWPEPLLCAAESAPLTKGTHTLTINTQGPSLCDAHKALHKGHKARGPRRRLSHQPGLPAPLATNTPRPKRLLARLGSLMVAIPDMDSTCGDASQPIRHQLLPGLYPPAPISPLLKDAVQY